MRFINFKNLITLLATSTTLIKVKGVRIESCTEPNTIALTFDDGPYEYTSELMDTLKAAGIRATFFVNGFNYWKDLPENKEKQQIWVRATQEGHQIASHTWNHNIPENQTEFEENMKKLDDLVEANTGYRPTYARAPLGHCDEECTIRFEKLGYKLIQWDDDSFDWDYEKGSDGQIKNLDKVIEQSHEKLQKRWDEKKENYLVLMHDVYEHTVKQIVPWFIENNPYKDYKFVTVAECLGDKEFASLIKTNNNDTSSNLNATTTDANNGTNNDSQKDSTSNGVLTSSISIYIITLLTFAIYLLF
ncbi:glycoside hydrolase/deacetylase [Anaeromyces robustus]|uniref:Glycoside hydrolase/deacetylase n=1 Tax=Anaeromyces robustus TaxID=1754192 RepID=A0A1Y1WT23_9FUNG|nr:glycoside hydrolase/deacetylase [Anaeromyces robustus]|eukprot:ORX76545.1 glycoside hydrolase/deacetylase [Anaeromyces robustus]